jgi:hypothetical protein
VLWVYISTIEFTLYEFRFRRSVRSTSAFNLLLRILVGSRTDAEFESEALRYLIEPGQQGRTEASLDDRKSMWQSRYLYIPEPVSSYFRLRQAPDFGISQNRLLPIRNSNWDHVVETFMLFRATKGIQSGLQAIKTRGAHTSRGGIRVW